MKQVVAYLFALIVTAALASASPQFSTAKTPVSKTAATRINGVPPGGFLGGSDDCAVAHTPAGFGDVFGVPFTTGTTGTAGQDEAGCYFFGTTGIDSDVWFDWTADATGNASLSSCAGTSVDTKVAAWPGTPGTCPADGTSLACNDDACGFQSTMIWSVTSGSAYTLQVGTFPGASGGTGTFDIFQSAPPPCGTYDDGTTENALGLTAGGEIGWLHYFDCFSTVDMTETAYGSIGGANPPNGNGSRIAVYEDPGCTGAATSVLTPMWSTSTTTVNVGTDILNVFPYPGTGTNIASSGCTWVLATGDHLAGEFPAPLDESGPTMRAWVVGSTLGAGTVDIANLNNNNVLPVQMEVIGFPGAWLLRAQGTETDFPGLCSFVSTGESLCFGDGSGTPCSCGNEGSPGAGCGNSTGAGATLSASGEFLSLAMTVSGAVPNQPGLLFQGGDTLMGGSGLTFGDGIRCCGTSVVRLELLVPDASGSAQSSINFMAAGGAHLGDTRCYQLWYRDPQGSPCGESFNLTNAIEIDFASSGGDLDYGVRIDGGQSVAYIGLAGGQDFISVPFDPVLHIETESLIEVLGLDINELQSLEGQPNLADVQLLLSPELAAAATLWSSGFSAFAGTPGEVEILSRLSQHLLFIAEKASPFCAAAPWTSDGCTLAPAFNFEHCCDAHDACYCAGGGDANRLACDQALRACIEAEGHPVLAALYYWAVRAFGGFHFNDG